MASRIKEDERNEKIIRGLMKLPPNKRCINCNNLGPQYVCTNFWTFICTNCSGLHREFCHRVKSISMAKFTTQEVTALQEGGNEKAKEKYFKEWDPQRQSLPDSSNIDKLRTFIKHVYVDRRFTGERGPDRSPSTDRPPRGKPEDAYRGDSRSPPYNDRFDSGGRNGDKNVRFVYGERSPRYDHGDNRKSPRRFEVVDDRVRDDRVGTSNPVRRFEEKLPSITTKPEESSPNRLKEMSNSPIVRSVKEILGDDAPQLQVGDTPKSYNTPKSNNIPKSNISSIPNLPVQTQGVSSPSGTESTGVISTQPKNVDLLSLIDFSTNTEQQAAAASPVAAIPQPSHSQQQNFFPASHDDWASFDNIGRQIETPAAAANTGGLNSVPAQLSGQRPAPGPGTSYQSAPANFGTGASPRANMHQQQTTQFPSGPNQPPNPAFNASVAGAQPWGSPTVSSTHGSSANVTGHSSHVAGGPNQETSLASSSQPSSADAKHTGRQALPEDLFTALYPPSHMPMPGWQRGPYPGYMYGMQQYPMGMPQMMQQMPTSSFTTYQSKSTNPFDVGSEQGNPPASNPMFPSLAPLQGALPHLSAGPSPLVRSTSLGNPSPQVGYQQQGSPQLGSPQLGSPQLGATQQSYFQNAVPQGQYMMQQQVQNNMPQNRAHTDMYMMGNQGNRAPGSPSAVRSNLGMNQQHRFSHPNAPNPHAPSGGNPFG